MEGLDDDMLELSGRQHLELYLNRDMLIFCELTSILGNMFNTKAQDRLLLFCSQNNLRVPYKSKRLNDQDVHNGR
jgi:hypothetical protein